MGKQMRAFLKYAVIFSLLSIITKIALWKNGLLQTDANYSTISYLFFLLLCILFTSWDHKKKHSEPTAYLDDVKYAMRSVGIFSLIISSFTYFYYSNLDPGFFPGKINERLEIAANINLEEIRSPEKLTREKVLENEKRIAEMFFNNFNHSSITLFSFLFFGALYSSIIVWGLRKIPIS